MTDGEDLALRDAVLVEVLAALDRRRAMIFSMGIPRASEVWAAAVDACYAEVLRIKERGEG